MIFAFYVMYLIPTANNYVKAFSVLNIIQYQERI